MNGSISGCLTNAVAGEIISLSEISLTRAGVPGESRTQADDSGRFAFTSLQSGNYSLGVHDSRYAPLYCKLVLEDGASIEDLQISLTPAAFIKGLILDEDGLPPHHCWFTLMRSGGRRGESGYISDSGDHMVDKDGNFSSPSLNPGRYALRFAGILKKPSGEPRETNPSVLQNRIFDFVYPNVQDVRDAAFFDLQIGEILDNLELRIPRPVWRTVRGKLTGVLPSGLANTHVHFIRDGMIDDFGGGGARVDFLGAFEYSAQPGRYKLRVWEMAPPEQNGYTRMTKQFATAEVVVGDCDLDGVEIEISSPTVG